MFDHDGRLIEWLGKSQYAKPEIGCQDNCLICSLLGDTPEVRITKHGYWCSRERSTNHDREIWLVHRDPDRGLWNATITPPIQYVPAAILFVSQRGSSQEFGGKEPQVVEVPFPEGGGKAYLPIFYHDAGLYSSSTPEEFEELLRCFDIALETRDWRSQDEVLDSFGRSALLSSSTYWPHAIHLRDDAEHLFYLWCAVRLRKQDPSYAWRVEEFLLWEDLAIARRHGDSLDAYLAGIHGGVFVPLACRAELVRALRIQRDDVEPLQRKGIVDRWLEGKRNFAARLRLNGKWNDIAGWIHADLEKWTADVI